MRPHQQYVTDAPTIQTALTVMALVFPVRVVAQELNATIIWLFVGAPVAVLMTTVVVAIVVRSWKILLVGIASLVFWISWYWVAAQVAREDFYFWIPIVAIHLQAALAGGCLCWRLLGRRGS